MTDYNVATYNPVTKRLGVPQSGDRYSFPKAAQFDHAITTSDTIDGRDVAADGTKLDLIIVTGSHDLDTRFTQVDALQTKQDFLTLTQAVDLDTMEATIGYLTVTQAVDLDTIEARVNALDAAVTLKGDWDASTLLFPTSTVSGESWICSVAGTVDAVDFEIGDRVVALVDSALNNTYVANWLKLDYTDKVSSVAGRTGTVVLVENDITDLQAYTLPADFDSLAKLNALCGESILVSGAIDTFAELQAIVADEVLLAETSIDSLDKLNALMAAGGASESNFLLPGGYDFLLPDGVSHLLFQSKTVLIDTEDSRLSESVRQFIPSPTDPTYAEGAVWYSSVRKTLNYYTDEPDVTMNIGEEMWVRVRNDTGVLIADGVPVYISGVSGGLPQITPVMANAEHCLGVTTHSIETGTIGYVTRDGTITGPDLSLFGANDDLYLSSTVAGELVNVAPSYPNTVYRVGTVLDNSNPGTLLVDIEHLSAPHEVQTPILIPMTFAARTAASGAYYLAGNYDAPTADANLTQAATTVTYGTANSGHATHAFMVFGAGSTDGTSITITVTGTSITDAGVRTPADSEVLYTGTVAALTLDDYLETSKKWLGQVTYTLTSDGVNFTCDFNYGFCKYYDYANQNFTLDWVECTGLANANDTGFNIELLHHTNLGWTYAATGFVPGNTAIESWSADHSTDNELVGGEHFAWKHLGVNTPVVGADADGFLVRVTTGASNSVSYMNGHVSLLV